MTAYLCIMGQRLTFSSKLNRIGRRSESESDKGDIELLGVNPKPDDLSMARMKVP